MIDVIAVVGAGTMGHGVAETFAMNGYPVHLFDVSAEARGRVKGVIEQELGFLAENDALPCGSVEEALDRITIYDDLREAVKDADYVIESAPEDLALKQALFQELDSCCKPECILASNTSTLPLKDMMEKVSAERRARMMVCHWYNPPHLIPIAELSCFGNMDENVFQQVYDLHVRAGKRPVRVLKDIPGLIANRMLHAMAREVFHLVEIGAASPEDIDVALKFGPGFRAATTGILEAVDMGGLDVWCACEDNLFSQLDNSTSACEFLREKVEQGKLGLKSGAGFYDYPQRDAVKNAFNKRLLTQLKASERY